MKTACTYQILHCVTSTLYRFRRFIVDTDAGVDDAIALVMALTMTLNATTTQNAPPPNLATFPPETPSSIQIEAITTVTGNAPADQVAINVWRVLKAMGKEKVKRRYHTTRAS